MKRQSGRPWMQKTEYGRALEAAMRPRIGRPSMKPEDSLTTNIIDTARMNGWRVMHARPAQTARGWRTAIQGHAGFPDLVLVRGTDVLYVELKCGRNKLSPEQEAWRDALLAAGARWELWTDVGWKAGKYDAVLGINEHEHCYAEFHRCDGGGPGEALKYTDNQR